MQGMGTTAELKDVMVRDGLAKSVAQMWDNFKYARQEWETEQQELRNFLFATDTRKTSNASLPWKNSTTLPKLTQLRDNLHANYLSALFPNDDWLRWEAYSADDNEKKKRESIQAYMSNKMRESGSRNVFSQLLYDFIDYGNAFGDVIWVNETKIDEDTGETIQGYVGPKVIRISPEDIVFNILAPDFKSSPKIVRSLVTLGDLERMKEDNPNLGYMQEAIDAARDFRGQVATFKAEDFNKSIGFEIDGFGSMYEYFNSGTVEILELEGSIHDVDTGEFLKDCVVTIIDRSFVVRKATNPSWMRGGYKFHVGWRTRPDNLMAMGPLNNLVGMQYRIDHLENAKADAIDQYIHPPKIIKGDVDEFDWGPDEEIHVDADGTVEILRPDLSAIVNTQQEIQIMMNMMEEFAGAPKQAMGIRTPGEKTAFEVQALENAAGRIFQEKITSFEINGVEVALNGALELARRMMDARDIVRVMDDDLGVEDFLTITKEDITAKGKLRPIGARHFSARANRIQTLTQLSATPIWQQIQPHISNKNLAKMVEDILDLNRFDLVRDNVQVFEQADTQRLVNQVQEELAVEQQTPPEPGMMDGEPPV